MQRGAGVEQKEGRVKQEGSEGAKDRVLLGEPTILQSLYLDVATKLPKQTNSGLLLEAHLHVQPSW